MTNPANPEANAPPIAQGTMLAGKYRVERVIGEGGMGVVVEARHMALDERVAMKFLTSGYAQHPEAAARFLREARAAVKIKSEHVARVSDVGTLENGAPYMVMELLQGNDLSQELQKKGVLPLADAVDYIIQACEAIAEAHGAGIVHRDLKPANLFLSHRQDGSALVKVLDFGISKMAESSVENLTKTMTAMGSALYMSPEQMQQTRGVDHRTDIYALGVALYELLAGKQPYYAETLPQLCAEVLTGTPTPLRQVRPELPPELAPAIEKAYARDRGDRYSSIAHFVIALAPFAPQRSQTLLERIAKVANLPVPVAGMAAAPVVPWGDAPLAGGGTIALDPPPGGGQRSQSYPGPPGPPAPAQAITGPGQAITGPGGYPSQSGPPGPPGVMQSSSPGQGGGFQPAQGTGPNMEIATLARPSAKASKAPIFIGLALAFVGMGLAGFFVATSPRPPAQAGTEAPGDTVVAPAVSSAVPAATAAPPPTTAVTDSPSPSGAPAATAPSAPASASAVTAARPPTASPSGKPSASATGAPKSTGTKPKSIFDDR